MAGSINERISSAEEKWLDLVRPYCANLFSETFIPSHDHKHHQRVWDICKLLLIELDRFNAVAGQDLVEGLMLAAWFHDTGMVKDSGIRHGALGREEFETFIRNTVSVEPEQYSQISEAIEFHDTKGPSAYPKLKTGTAPGILGILSVADDLDALGTIGIYRYVEIYLEREVPIGELGIKILDNVRRRFAYIIESCTDLPGIVDPHRTAYQKIEDFFKLYNQQLMLEKEAEKVSRGQLGIVNLIRRFSLDLEIRPEKFRDQPEIHSGEDMVKNYFYELHRELELKNK